MDFWLFFPVSFSNNRKKENSGLDFQLPFSKGIQPLLVKGIVFSVFALNFLLYSVGVMYVTMKTRVMPAGKMVFWISSP